MTIQRISSLDLGYTTGQLSLFPSAKDTKDQLYYATNNAETILKQTLTYNGKYIIVNNNDKFPARGILRIGPPAGKSGNYELVYYNTKSSGVFKDLIRGFAGSRQGQWYSESAVIGPVTAEHRNTLKDAVIQIQNKIGEVASPQELSLNKLLKSQEDRFLSPKPVFRAYPTKGPPQLKVRFQNFSAGPLIRYLWDFGDGSTSIEKNPIHTYATEGIYSVKLNLITSLGAQGVTTKSNYIIVADEERIPFFYITPKEGYSKETADFLDIEPTVFKLVDQTDGDVIQRYWILDGSGTSNNEIVENNSIPVLDPNIHTANYTYDQPGEYEPSLLVLFANQKSKRVFLKETITVK